MPHLPIEALGAIAAILTTLCWLPQVVQIFRTRDTRSISLITQSAFLAGVALWFGYGLMIGSYPVIVSNALTMVLASAILGMKLRYG
jgi:MtN3 and saliva related transmembrane protein